MRAWRTGGAVRRAAAATVALLLGAVGLAIGAGDPAQAAPPNMIYHPQGSPPYNFPFGYSGPFGQVIFDRTLTGGTVTFFADGVAMPECTFTVDASPSYSCWLRRQLDPGSYDIRVDYSGFGADEPTSSVGTPITVHAVETVLGSAVVTTPDPGATTEVRANLRRDETGATGPVAGVTLHFSVSGGGSCDGLTDSTGTAACQLVLPTTSTSLTIRFDGDARHQDTELTVPVELITPTTTALVLNPSPTPWNTGVTATATISPAPTGGTVVFSTPAGTRCVDVTPSGSTASCTFLAPLGTTPVTATYSGSATHARSSGTATLIGQARPTTLTIAAHEPLLVGVPANVDARLVDTLANVGAPAGLTVTITLGSESCPATTGANGVASCQITPAATAPTTLTAAFTGTAQYGPDTGQTTVAVAKGPTSVALTSSPAQYEAPLTITATVSAADGGTVGFRTGGESIGGCAAAPVALAGGQWRATCTTTELPAGSSEVTAAYSGTTNYATSPDASTTVTVTPAATALSYTGATTATVGRPLTAGAILRSEVTGRSIADQPITFAWGGDDCIAVTDAAGAASCELAAASTAGPATLTVGFVGDVPRFAATTASASISVGKAPTSTAVGVPTAAVFGEPSLLTASVEPGDGAGTVAFTVSGTPIPGCGAATLVPATGSRYQAACNTTALPAGTHTVGATFSGTAGYDGSSGTASLTVAPAPTALTYTGDTAGTVGVPITVRATLERTGAAARPLAGRIVTFTTADGACSDDSDAEGVATCTITPDHAAPAALITVTFEGTDEYSGAVAAAEVEVVPAPTTTALDAPGTATFGAPVALTARVAPSLGGGTVTFTQAADGRARADIPGCIDRPLVLEGADWVATCTTTALVAGQVTVTAAYSGDADHVASSASAAVTITPAPTALAYAGDTEGTVATPLTLTATLTAGTEGGTPVSGATMAFALAELACTAVTDATGTASCDVTPTSVDQAGTVHVTFVATDEYMGATAEGDVELEGAPTITSLAAPATAGFSRPIQLVATVSPFALAGTITFADGGVAIPGCEAVPVTAAGGAGTATCATTAPAVGAHELSASFGGNGSYLASVSEPRTLGVVVTSTDLIYLGPSTAPAGAPVTVSAALVAVEPVGSVASFAARQRTASADAVDLGIPGHTLVFTFGDTSCAAVTAADGVGSCALVPSGAAAGTIVVSFAGAPGLAPSTEEVAFAVAAAPVPPPDPTMPDPGTPTLPATGSDPATVVFLALALVVVGLGVTRVRRRSA